MGQISDAERPAGLVSTLMSALPPGSFLTLSDGTDTDEALITAVGAYNGRSADTYHLRSPREIASFFAGLEPVEPGVVSTAAWRPDADRAGEDTADVSVCGVAVKK